MNLPRSALAETSSLPQLWTFEFPTPYLSHTFLAHATELQYQIRHAHFRPLHLLTPLSESPLRFHDHVLPSLRLSPLTVFLDTSALNSSLSLCPFFLLIHHPDHHLLLCHPFVYAPTKITTHWKPLTLFWFIVSLIIKSACHPARRH